MILSSPSSKQESPSVETNYSQTNLYHIAKTISQTLPTTTRNVSAIVPFLVYFTASSWSFVFSKKIEIQQRVAKPRNTSILSFPTTEISRHKWALEVPPKALKKTTFENDSIAVILKRSPPTPRQRTLHQPNNQ